ncbi:hypothetical protein HY008_00755 [Candidatus Woesebacteria bacterium]|nr:hypothetical protein [Candidatus Woesebacteria bacterium]
MERKEIKIPKAQTSRIRKEYFNFMFVIPSNTEVSCLECSLVFTEGEVGKQRLKEVIKKCQGYNENGNRKSNNCVIARYKVR